MAIIKWQCGRCSAVSEVVPPAPAIPVGPCPGPPLPNEPPPPPGQEYPTHDWLVVEQSPN